VCCVPTFDAQHPFCALELIILDCKPVANMASSNQNKEQEVIGYYQQLDRRDRPLPGSKELYPIDSVCGRW